MTALITFIYQVLTQSAVYISFIINIPPPFFFTLFPSLFICFVGGTFKRRTEPNQDGKGESVLESIAGL